MVGKKIPNIFPMNDNPGPQKYEQKSTFERVKSAAVIRTDIYPKNNNMGRIPRRKIPGPADYDVDIAFMAQ